MGTDSDDWSWDADCLFWVELGPVGRGRLRPAELAKERLLLAFESAETALVDLDQSD